MSCEILSSVLRNAPAAVGNGNAEDTPVTRSWRDALGETRRSLPPRRAASVVSSGNPLRKSGGRGADLRQQPGTSEGSNSANQLKEPLACC